MTAGYINPGPRAEFFRAIDAANVDLKGFTESFYYRRAAAHIAPVLDTLKYLRLETDVWLEITTLLIPGENDFGRRDRRVTRWVAEELGDETPLHFSPLTPTTGCSTIRRPRGDADARPRATQGRRAQHVYVGNVRDPEARPCSAPVAARC